MHRNGRYHSREHPYTKSILLIKCSTCNRRKTNKNYNYKNCNKSPDTKWEKSNNQKICTNMHRYYWKCIEFQIIYEIILMGKLTNICSFKNKLIGLVFRFILIIGIIVLKKVFRKLWINLISISLTIKIWRIVNSTILIFWISWKKYLSHISN